MIDKITKKQLEELDYAESFDRNEYNRLLEKYTGITAKAYTGFSYYDGAGNYLGDSNEDDVRELLKYAYIEVTDNV